MNCELAKQMFLVILKLSVAYFCMHKHLTWDLKTVDTDMLKGPYPTQHFDISIWWGAAHYLWLYTVLLLLHNHKKCPLRMDVVGA